MADSALGNPPGRAAVVALSLCVKRAFSSTGALMETVQTIFEQKYVHVGIDHAAGILTARWIGFLQLDEVMEGSRVMGDAIRTHGLKRYLSDHTELKVLKASVQNYLIGEAFPNYQRAGLERVAVLSSGDVFTQATVENVNGQVTSNRLKFAVFPTREACYAWLLG